MPCQKKQPQKHIQMKEIEDLSSCLSQLDSDKQANKKQVKEDLIQLHWDLIGFLLMRAEPVLSGLENLNTAHDVHSPKADRTGISSEDHHHLQPSHGGLRDPWNSHLSFCTAGGWKRIGTCSSLPDSGESRLKVLNSLQRGSINSQHLKNLLRE